MRWWSTCRTVYTVLEIFAGRAKLTQVARDRDGWRALDPVDLHYGQDLRNAHKRFQVMEAIRNQKPDLATLGPDVGL